MKLLIQISIILLITQNSLFAQQSILPNFMTEQEKQIYEKYIPPVYPNKLSDPPTTPVRAMAEWEELQGIMIAWTSFPSILSQIVDYAQEECLVYIVCSDSNSVKNYLASQSIPLYNLKFMVAPFNSIWIRDYGPWTAYTVNEDSLDIIDWIYNRPRPLDDQIPGIFANFINVPIFAATTPPYNLTHTGGNFMVDGHGTGFASKLILQENPGKTEAEIDTIMNKFLGLNRFIKMNVLPYDDIHHIDMHMKLLDEETLLVGQYPTGVADGPQIEANLQYILTNFQTCYGRPFKVVRIPMPPDQYGRYPDTGGDYRTYTNSMIVNKTIIIPTYEYQYDTTAFRIYREAMPGYNIVGINSNSIIPLLGTIHCIVKEVGVKNPLYISHAPLMDVPDTTSMYKIEAIIKHNTGIYSAEVYWTTDTTQGFSALPMTPTSGDSFITSIPQQSGEDKIFYYILAEAQSGKTITKPITAPAGYYNFNILQTTPITPASQTKIESYTLLQNYPNPFNPETTIEFLLPRNEFVRLTIYNTLGEKVAEIASGNFSAGKNSVTWNAGNISGGIYFYRIETDTFSKTKKLVILK